MPLRVSYTILDSLSGFDGMQPVKYTNIQRETSVLVLYVAVLFSHADVKAQVSGVV